MKERPTVDLTIRVTRMLSDLAGDVGLDIQAFCEAALREEVTRRWKEQNRDRVEAWNAWIEENGLPLEKYRLF